MQLKSKFICWTGLPNDRITYKKKVKTFCNTTYLNYDIFLKTLFFSKAEKTTAQPARESHKSYEIFFISGVLYQLEQHGGCSALTYDFCCFRIAIRVELNLSENYQSNFNPYGGIFSKQKNVALSAQLIF